MKGKNIREFKNGKLINSINKDEYDTFGCELIEVTEKKYEYIRIPKKRNGVFKLLKHKNNGFEKDPLAHLPKEQKFPVFFAK